MAFDKTGTLTEDGLDLFQIVPSHNGKFQAEIRADDDLRAAPTSSGGGGKTSSYDHVIYGLATCHQLVVIDREISGDPLDVIMFEASGWKFVDAQERPQVVSAVRFDKGRKPNRRLGAA